ncbi:MAG: DUF1501 domain-containing protein [Acidobacteria bacterium]|nr:DUF1501 domain-containing protein [Acidobacteriota bacterium]MCI0621529.1 DUF1501 domain-containing protein [Acidobacteriota bacterium]MCI0725024.1 DUF1501 domain-containing protein [Acidobacteriota bacterium]
MPPHESNLEELFLTRRELLCRCGMGMGATALATLLGDALSGSAEAAASLNSPMAPRAPHFTARAKRVIHLFMNGGPSHVDTFDPKPALEKYAGKEIPTLKTERKTGGAFPSPFQFKRYGQSGIEVSELFARTAENADDICLIRSMQADVPNHQPSILLMNCGEARLIRPSLGSWVTYGLGTENQNLPGFVVMCPGGFPDAGPQNWRSAFLPGAYQGTHIDTRNTEIEKLIENVKNTRLCRHEQPGQLDLLRRLNDRHRRERDKNAQIEARIHSFELAYRMQMEATDAFDISQEPESIRQMYGEGVQARQILIARRLLERGVRFVQVWHSAGAVWDQHEDLETRHRALAGQCDQAIGALLKDLKQRGMLQDTLVIWGGEFGRTPTVEHQAKRNGRDHNHYGFSTWLAGGGVKGGYIHGATDEFGFKAVEKPVHVHDLHATILHLLGFDHKRLTYRHAGRDFRLTDVHGQVVTELVA